MGSSDTLPGADSSCSGLGGRLRLGGKLGHLLSSLFSYEAILMPSPAPTLNAGSRHWVSLEGMELAGVVQAPGSRLMHQLNTDEWPDESSNDQARAFLNRRWKRLS
jgi:hypothetical protein